MSNPLLDPAKFGPAAGPPTAWPGQPGAPVPPAADNVPGAPWPPPPPSGSGATLRRQGVASATAVLLAIIAVVGIVGWNLVKTTTDVVVNAQGQVVEETSVSIPPWMIGAVLLGFVLVIATYFKPAWARVTAPLYAVAEGLFVGAISKFYEVRFEGIVLQAVGLTIGVFVIMLVLYATGRIRVTPRFRLGIIAATGGIMLIYVATAVMRLFGGDMPYIHGAGPVGIGFSLVVVVIAALNLTLDFDFIDRAERAGAPRELEWFAALGLVVTLVWLYLELLRLLGKIRR
ncbi:MAG TPA: Bax inhibitor-1/YccA family protein [Iamia sp.]|nr:Bax inhibitor-1/YccA family protein [Iamia sp.]